MKFAVVQFPTKLAEDFSEEFSSEITPVAVCIFPRKAMDAAHFTDETILIMTLERRADDWVFVIGEENPEPVEGELTYEPIEVD